MSFLLLIVVTQPATSLVNGEADEQREHDEQHDPIRVDL
jgi:hypothetical protein